MNVNHILRTERLILRPVTVHDHTALLTHWTDPEVRRFLFDGEVLPPASWPEPPGSGRSKTSGSSSCTAWRCPPCPASSGR